MIEATLENELKQPDKRSVILASAEKLFAVNGFDGASVRDIAHDAGVNVAMISYYFGSKEKLMEALFEQKTSIMRLKVENLLHNKQLTPLQKIYVLIDEYVEKFIKQREFHKIMMREQIIEKDNPVSGMIVALKKKNLESIKLLIAEGQKAGAFKKNIDIVLMMNTMIGTVSQMVTSQQFYRSVNNMENIDEKQFGEFIKKKLCVHLKKLFKSSLTHE